MHDVLIIGAGPGGSATAHFLLKAAAGLDVLLVDRATFPRDKTCGDGLTPRALRVLDGMGLRDEVERRGCPIGGYEVVAPNHRTTTATITSDPGAVVLPRRELDNMLLEQAIKTGAQFESAVAVSRIELLAKGVRVYAENGRTFDTRLAVVATGAAFGVLTRSGILKSQPRAMLAARAYFENLQADVGQNFQLRFDNVPQPGYGWIFPVTRAKANVGVGFLPHPGSPTVTQSFDRFVASPAVAALLRGSHQTGPMRGYPIRVDFLRAPTSAPHTLLVGEAAGLVNPLTGEGIDYALESGQVAAGVLARSFAHTRPLDTAEYHALLHQRFARTFQFSEWVRDWYCKPPLLNVLVPLANRHPELRQMLASIVLGEREPRGYGPLTMLGRLVAYLASPAVRRRYGRA
ncbi:MAG: geranylgeranyl reductase family protein [Chloroflexota bacterium]